MINCNEKKDSEFSFIIHEDDTTSELNDIISS